MQAPALAPVIGYDKAFEIARHALEHDPTLREAASQLGYVDETTFDRVVCPAKTLKPCAANGGGEQVLVEIPTPTAQNGATR